MTSPRGPDGAGKVSKVDLESLVSFLFLKMEVFVTFGPLVVFHGISWFRGPWGGVPVWYLTGQYRETPDHSV